MKRRIISSTIIVLAAIVIMGCAGKPASVSSLEAVYNDSKAHNYQGFIHWAIGQYDQAIVSYNRTLEIDPKSAEVYNNRGAVYHSKQQYDRAIARL